jgi:hypothetical protein
MKPFCVPNNPATSRTRIRVPTTLQASRDFRFLTTWRIANASLDEIRMFNAHSLVEFYKKVTGNRFAPESRDWEYRCPRLPG